MTTIGNWGQLRTISNNWQHHHPSCDFGRPCLSSLLMTTEALLRHWLQQKTNKLQQLFKTHSCGVWKCLWKTEETSLMKRNNGGIRSVSTIVTVCCGLHNLCKVNRDASKETWICTQTESSKRFAVKDEFSSYTKFRDRDSGSTMYLFWVQLTQTQGLPHTN